MKKFICRIAIYLAMMSAIILMLNTFYVPKLRMTDKTAKMMNVPDNIQICNFGSSHGYFGFNYKDAMPEYTCFNFALESQSSLYDYRIMQNYEHKISKGAAVFLLVSYFSLFGKPETQDGDFASKNKRYYRFLSAKLIEQYDARTDFYVNYFPVLASDNLMSLLEILRHKKKQTQQTAKPASPKNFDDGETRYMYHVANRFNKDGTRMRNEENIKALYGMVALCREIGAMPILVTTPYLSYYPNAVRRNDPSFFADFYGVINKFLADTGIKYYDYSEDERFKNNTALFANSDHLNSEGARIFTDTLLLEALSIDVMPPE